ncbi:spore germination protein [Butyricicoccus faecihominis]|uniref:spore germination protein n=1 Tax=Butyricicoccus faecihominis TaxID=1712515 RepID=UPI0024794CF3|nr:spore germination protein [Butyricicoccus faecihominis]MCQ5129344.1 spore germination protein [Butyricicoccus faecihominis]
MSSFDSRVSALRQALAVNKSFDLLERPVRFAGRRAMFTLIDGFVKDELFEKIMEFFYSLKQDDPCFADEQAFLDLAVPYCEAALEQDESKVVTAVLAGQTALLIEGFAQYVLLDIRTYPQRDTAEPEKDKVFRGSHDGFVETMVLNCALIRRRIRSPHLRMEAFTLGAASKTDVVLCYMADRADDALLKKLRDRLTRDGQQVDALTMNSESLAELLLPHKWYNPFPRFKYTERPDAAAAQVLEGDVVLLVDNSPAAMTLPTSIFDIMEEANDYYFPPLTGSYLRLTRFLVLLLMLLVTPLWLLVNQNPTWLPEGLAFLIPSEPPAVPLFWQLIILELGIDGLKLATLNTPSMLTTSLSVIAGIVVGDFAVKSGWFSSEAMLYMAFVALGGFNQPSFELGYAMKFMRMGLLILTVTLNVWGFLLGLLAILVILLSCKTFSGHSYLYPLIPFNGKLLMKKLFRPSVRRQ